MRYLLYFVVGPWFGQWAIISCIAGLCFLFSRRLIQPIHGFKARKILGTLFLFSAIASFTGVMKLGGEPISPAHLNELYQLEKVVPNSQRVFTDYPVEKDQLTEMDFFVLKQKLKRMGHPHFLRHTM